MLRDKLFHFFEVDPAFKLVFAVSHASQGFDGHARRQFLNQFVVETAHINGQSDYVSQPLSNEVDADVNKMSYSQKLWADENWNNVFEIKDGFFVLLDVANEPGENVYIAVHSYVDIFVVLGVL